VCSRSATAQHLMHVHFAGRRFSQTKVACLVSRAWARSSTQSRGKRSRNARRAMLDSGGFRVTRGSAAPRRIVAEAGEVERAA
jgi:hypothetical protein